MGDRGEVISVELDPDRAAEVAAQATRLGLRSVTVFEGDATEAGIARGLRPDPARRALLGSRHARLPPRRPLAQVAAHDRAGGGGAGEGRSWRPRSCCGRAAPWSTRPARSPAARTRMRRRPSRPSSCVPHAITPTVSSSAARSAMMPGMSQPAKGEGIMRPAPARTAASRGCARRTSPAATAACTACTATSCARVCPNCGEHSTIAPDVIHRHDLPVRRHEAGLYGDSMLLPI